MLARRATLILFLALLCPSLTRAEDPRTITARAKTLDEFLANQTWVDDYYDALKRKYGADKFPRESFDLVLGQLRDIKDKVPGLKERLWEKGEGKTFSITLVTANYGREVNMDLWRAHLKEVAAKLETEAGEYAGMKTDAALKKSAQLIAKRNAELQAFNQAHLKKAKLNKDESREVGEFFKAIAEDKNLREAIAFRTLHEVRSEDIQDRLLGGNADSILDTMRTLRKYPAKYLPGVQNKETGFQSHLRALLPEFQRLYAQTDIFPKDPIGKPGGESVFTFSPVDRVFDGIWKGISLGECVGGNCHHDASLTPERWLSSALEGARLYEVNEALDGAAKYRGFVQLVPIRNKRTGKTVASVDFGAAILKDKANAEDPASGEKRVTTLLARFLAEAPEHLPADLRDLVVGKSKAINNATVLDHLHNSLEYLLGASAGHSSDYELKGGLATSIIAASPPRVGHALTYGGRMIFDAFVPEAGELRVLLPGAEDKARDPVFVKGLLNGTDEDGKLRWVRYLRGHKLLSPEFAALRPIQRALLKEKIAAAEVKYEKAAKWDAMRKIRPYVWGAVGLSQALIWGIYAAQGTPEVFDSFLNFSLTSAGIEALVLGADMKDYLKYVRDVPDARPREVRLLKWDLFKLDLQEALSRVLAPLPSCVREYMGVAGSP